MASNDFLHLGIFVSCLLSIVVMIVSGHSDQSIVEPLLVILGAQVGYKLGDSKNANP